MAENNAAADQEFLEDGVTPNPEYKKPEAGGEGGKPADPPQNVAGEDEESDIPVRQSAAQVIARQKRTIEKLRSKEEEEEGAEYEPTTGDENDEELTPGAQTAVQKEVKRQVAPLMKDVASRADEQELQDLYASDPDAKQYDKQIRAYMKIHPTATPGMIYHHLAFDAAETTGAGKRTAADTDAGQQRGGGSSIRSEEVAEGGVPSIEEQNEMSDEDIEAVEQKARSGGFAPKEE